MRYIVSICIGLIIAINALAQVNEKNGLFYSSYTDLSVQGSNWTVERSYNSFASDKGMFGLGWSTNMATRLWPLPDGQLMVLPFGSGTGDLYLCGRTDISGMYLMIDSIVADEIRRNKLTRSPKDIVRRRSELVIAPSERANAYVAFLRRSSKDCQPMKPMRVTRWVNEFREQEIIEWADGLFRLDQYNRQYYFDACGRLVRWKTQDDDVRFYYNKELLRSIIVNGRDSAIIRMDSSGLVQSISASDSNGKIRQSRYQYNQAGFLIRSIDVEDNQYDYEYDRNYYMTFTRYTDGRYRRMDYDPATGQIVGFRERNGDSTRYEYGYMYLPDGHVNLDHFFTRVRIYDSARTKIFNRYSETEFRIAANGERYRYKIIEQSDTSQSINLYPSHVGNVIYRKVNEREAWSDYDSKTRPIYLRLKDSVYTTRYNLIGLPDRFQAIDSVRRDTVTYQYQYNAKGQLSTVFRNQVKYSLEGSVSTGVVSLIQGNQKWVLGFKAGNPEYLVDPKLGKVSLKHLDGPAQANLRSQLYDLLSLVIPQKIQHEWIWERF